MTTVLVLPIKIGTSNKGFITSSVCLWLGCWLFETNEILAVMGCYSLFSNISNSFWFKYSFSLPTFSDFKKPFSSKAIK